MNRSILSFVFIFIAQLALSNDGTGDLPEKEIIQSPFYDALAVHFANMGYWVYFIPKAEMDELNVPETESSNFGDPGKPVQLGTEESNEGPTPNTGNLNYGPSAVPDPVNKQPKDAKVTTKDSTKKEYLNISIVNSMNGQMIETKSLHKDSIYDHLNTHYYDEDGDTTRLIISEVFLRNARLDPSLGMDTISKVYLKNSNWDDAFLNYLPEDQKIVKAEIDSLAKFNTKYLSKEGGAGPFSTSIFAEGLAEFLIMRVSEEMDLLFISQFQQAFEKYIEIQTLFPNTYEYLKHRSYEDLTLSLPAFKEATKTDMSNFVYNISEIGDLEKLKPVFNEHPSLSILFTVCKVAGLLQQNKTPAYIIHEIYTSEYLYHNTEVIHNPTSFIKLTGMFSDAMLDVRKGQTEHALTWIGKNKLSALSNKKFYSIYSCLIYQASPEITFKLARGDTIKIKELISDSILYSIQETLTDTQKSINKKLKDNEDLRRMDEEGKINISILENYALIVQQLMSTVYEIGNVLVFKDTVYREFLTELKYINDSITPIITKAIATSKHIHLEQYSSAITEGYTILSDYLIPLVEKQITEEKSISKDNKKLLQAFIKSKDEVLRYGLFISSVAVAETSEDVSVAIKTFSLPAGSHRIKKRAVFSVGLNAYLGVFHGVGEYKDTSGLTAPLGLSFNVGFGNAGGISLTGYIIDVGAIVTSKIDSSQEVSNEIIWGNLFSPGFAITYNLPILRHYSLPFTVGFSRQWGPELQGGYNAGAIFKNKVPMNKLFIAFDIPITNFYVSRKRR